MAKKPAVASFPLTLYGHLDKDRRDEAMFPIAEADIADVPAGPVGVYVLKDVGEVAVTRQFVPGA